MSFCACSAVRMIESWSKFALIMQGGGGGKGGVDSPGTVK